MARNHRLCGSRTSITATSGFRNSPTLPFWAPGGGIAVKSHNNTHKSVVTSEERRSYAPNIGQTVFDTTLGMIVVCVDPDRRLWVDAFGKEIE